MTPPQPIYKPKGPFPVFLDDFLRDTAGLSGSTQWFYFKLCARIWEQGGWVDKRVQFVSRLTAESTRKVRSKLPELAPFLIEQDGYLGQKRVHKDLANARKRQEKMAKHRASVTGNKQEPVTTPVPPPVTDPRATPSPSPSKEELNSSSSVAEPPREPPRELRREIALIVAFDDARVEVFGPEQARPYPAHQDRVHAERFGKAGIALDTFKALCLAGQQAKKIAGEQPIGSLKYFEQAVADAIAAGNRPMPAGGKRGDTDDRTAMRKIVGEEEARRVLG
jgi:uncharacterized protein YdaU (DUF1376 family)